MFTQAHTTPQALEKASPLVKPNVTFAPTQMKPPSIPSLTNTSITFLKEATQKNKLVNFVSTVTFDQTHCPPTKKTKDQPIDPYSSAIIAPWLKKP